MSFAGKRPADFVPLKVRGVYRGEEERDLTIAFNREPTDDEMRIVQDRLSQLLMAAGPKSETQ
jgi:hypothetical protein